MGGLWVEGVEVQALVAPTGALLLRLFPQGRCCCWRVARTAAAAAAGAVSVRWVCSCRPAAVITAAHCATPAAQRTRSSCTPLCVASSHHEGQRVLRLGLDCAIEHILNHLLQVVGVNVLLFCVCVCVASTTGALRSQQLGKHPLTPVVT